MMDLFITHELAATRKGRFLIGMLDCTSFSPNKLPDQGLIFLTGDELVQLARRKEVISWGQQAGRVLLIGPPFPQGPLFADLDIDWKIVLSTTRHSAQAGDLAEIIQDEIKYELVGISGESLAHHVWTDGTLHSRYYQKHTNSGIIAVTCLPLWSLSLMDHAHQVREWIGWFGDQTGTAENTPGPEEQKAHLSPEDLNLLLCAYGLNTGQLQTVIAENQRLHLFNLARLNAEARWPELYRKGLMTAQGLTQQGLDALQKSAFWPYAKYLRGMKQ